MPRWKRRFEPGVTLVDINVWQKSSRCGESSHCVEVQFRRASFCESGACVEAAAVQGMMLVRDSKDPNGPVLRFDRDEWEAFVKGVKAGEFDF